LELSSPRTIVRKLRPDDAAAVAAYRSRPEVARFQSWDTFTPADAARLIADHAHVTPDTPDAWLQVAVTLAGPGTVIGDVGIHFLPDPRQVELGVTLDPAHQGRGLAAEAVGGVLRHLFETLGKHRVVATTDAANHPSARLFRRLGFRQEAHFVEHAWFKGAWGDEYLFAMLRREWQGQATAARQ
jgi:RimJ/RimL family protein N-acetyltransferase